MALTQAGKINLTWFIPAILAELIEKYFLHGRIYYSNVEEL